MIELSQRPDLRARLQTCINLINASCDLGTDIMQALASTRTQVLCLTDVEINDKLGKGAKAFYTIFGKVHCLGLRQSRLEGQKTSFGLLLDFAHEAIHIRANQNYPIQFSTLSNPKSPNCLTNTLAFEIEAFAGETEIALRLAVLEASKIAKIQGRDVDIRNTDTIKAWLQEMPKEAPACLKAFSEAIALGGTIQDGTNAARQISVQNFLKWRKPYYMQRTLANICAAGGDAEEAAKRWRSRGLDI